MATYEQLDGSSYTDLVVPFTSNNGLGVVDTCTRQLTGYTLSQTPFTFKAQLSALDNTYIGASMDKLIWDLGDGTRKTGVEVTHQYQYPGEYEITTIFTNQNGITHKNRMSQSIRVYNYVPDSLMWYTEAIADPLGGQPERIQSGRHSEDLYIYRMNSWQSWHVVSGDGGYFINLYAAGSKSRPLTRKQYENNADSHFVPSHRFVKSKDSYDPVERVQTGNEFIYVKVVDNEIVRAAPEDSTAIFAGTSGYTSVNYIDDNPNRLTSARPDEPSRNTAAAKVEFEGMTAAERAMTSLGDEDKDLILYASFDTSKFPVTKYDAEIADFELLKQNYFQIYETQKVGLPMQVRFNSPQRLLINSNGIPEPNFDIKGYKVVHSPISTTIRTADLHGNVVCCDELPTLSSRWSAPTTAFSGGEITTDVLTAAGFVTLYLSSADTTFTQIDTPYKSDDDFKIWDIGHIVPKNEANRFIRVVIADRVTKEIIPVDEAMPERDRTITILLSELHPDHQKQLEYIDASKHYLSGGEPREWITKSGHEYYGYLSPVSNFQDKEKAAGLEIETHTESYETPGSMLAITSLDQDKVKYKAETNKYRFYAHTLVDPPKSFTYEVAYYYVTNPTNDIIWQLKPSYYREYSYGDDGLTQTYTAPISTQTPGNSGLYGIAVEPLGDMIAVDGDTDKIVRYWRNQDLRAEVSIRDVMPPEIRANHYPDNPDAYGYTPSSVSFDSNFDYWVSFYDTVSAVKFSGETNLPIAYAVPLVENNLVTSRTQSPSSYWTEDASYSVNVVDGRPGEYGENLIVPSVAETCKNNDVVVTYTNPICSFICRYGPDGVQKYKYELPGEDRYFTGDVCVDLSDHVWAITDGTGLTYDGQPDLENPVSVLYSFDEQLTLRYTASSLEGTSFQDMLKPAPNVHEHIDLLVNMAQQYDYENQEYIETALLIEGFGDNENPVLTLYEGNTYYFVNQYYNNGKHPLKFQTIVPANTALPSETLPIDFDKSGDVITEGVAGYDSDTISIFINKDDEITPKRFLLVDQKFPNTIALVIEVIKKPIVDARPAESFKYMNNAAFVVPDNDQNIWVGWGNRFCSRFSQLRKRFDTTVAVGSAYEDTRYHPMSADLYERRDNAGRRSVIEGMSCDTANNLLVINNRDKVVYSMNSDNPSQSAYIEVNSYQPPASAFNWVPSLCSETIATPDSFLLYPDSHMTKEQIQAFLKNTQFTGTSQQKIQAYQNYNNIMSGLSGETKFRTCHGANPVSATGFESEICAIGDWTGWRWINKYDERPAASDETTGFVSITGMSEEFSLLPQRGTHEIVKVNEDLDFAGVVRSYMKQSNLVNNTKLYDDFMNAVFGTKSSGVEELGKRIYERIANYTMNIVDIDTCTVDALFSLAQMVNYKLQRVGYNIPAPIMRVIDLLSVNFTKLRGTSVTKKYDFEKYGNWNQDSVGVNLGSELMFVFPYMNDHGYSTGDYTYYNNEYYESLDSVPLGVTPTGHLDSRKYWKHWPLGHVKTMSRSRAQLAFESVDQTELDFEQWYNDYVPIKIKLIQNLALSLDKKIVLQNEHTKEYQQVQARMIRLEDGRVYKMDLSEDTNSIKYYNITTPNIRDDIENEQMSEIITYTPMYTQFDDEIITVIGNDNNRNSSIVLFRNRTYRFEIDSIGHPVIITEAPGLSASPSIHVHDQYIEFGKLTINTDDHPINGPLPDKLFYQSVNDPSIGGTILIRAVEEVDGYSTEQDGLTAYNLNISVSSHDELDRLGWGLSFPADDSAWQHYSIYEFIEPKITDVEYVNNVIDWENDKTTLEYEDTIAGDNVYDSWYGDQGHAEIMINKALRQGLGLFDGIESNINNSDDI